MSHYKWPWKSLVAHLEANNSDCSQLRGVEMHKHLSFFSERFASVGPVPSFSSASRPSFETPPRDRSHDSSHGKWRLHSNRSFRATAPPRPWKASPACQYSKPTPLRKSIVRKLTDSALTILAVRMELILNSKMAQNFVFDSDRISKSRSAFCPHPDI